MMAEPLSSVREHVVKLERFQFAFRQLIPDNVAMAAVSIDSVYDHMLKGFAYQLRYEVLGQEIDTRIVKYPTDWWQAFRARWLPMWWLRRWPICYAEVRMQLKALYPQLPIDQKPVYHVDISTPVASRD